MPNKIKANVDPVVLFAKQVKQMNPAVYKTMQREMKAAGQKIAGRAAENANWSRKIPRTLRWSSSNAKVTVRAGYASTPTARWFELGRTNISPVWKHPIFASPRIPRKRWHWTNMREPSRPYLAPALEEMAPEIVEDIIDAFVNAFNELLAPVTADSNQVMAEAA